MVKRECRCGCDHFRFKFVDSMVEDEFANICKNCDHTLSEHLNIRKQGRMIAIEDLINTVIILLFISSGFLAGYWYRGYKNVS